MPRILNRKGRGHRITVEEFNSFVEVNNRVAEEMNPVRFDPGASFVAEDRTDGVILVSNESAVNLEPGDAVGLGGPVNDVEYEDIRAVMFAMDPLQIAQTPAVADHRPTRLAIMVDGIPKAANGNTFAGRAVVSGLALAKVEIIETWHQVCGVIDDSGKLKSKPAHGFGIVKFDGVGDQYAVIRMIEECGRTIVSGTLDADLDSGDSAAIDTDSITIYDDDFIPAGQKIASGVHVRGLWQDDYDVGGGAFGGYVLVNSSACPVDQ